MKNRYFIDGDIVRLILERRNGSPIETLIDLADLEKVAAYHGKWYPVWRKNTNSFYAIGNIKKDNGKYTTIYLHRYLMDESEEMHIDHINHDTLDNRRRTNLRALPVKLNTKNRIKANKNTSTGVRNVSYEKRSQKYVVQLQIEGKNTCFGRFNTLEEAKVCAERNRAKYYKFQ